MLCPMFIYVKRIASINGVQHTSEDLRFLTTSSLYTETAQDMPKIRIKLKGPEDIRPYQAAFVRFQLFMVCIFMMQNLNKIVSLLGL